jgi:AraC-like DNA-binding protein
VQAIHVATDEIGDIEETFRIAPVAYLQRKPGPLGATINSVSTPRAEVREVSFRNDATIVSGVLPCFVLGVGTQGNPLLCGNVLRESQVAYVGGNNGGTAHFGGNAGWCNACVDAGLLQEVASIHRYSVPVGDGAQAIPRSTIAALASWLLQLARGGSGTELDDAQLDDEVALAVLRILNPNRKTDKPRHAHRRRMVRLSLEYIHAHFADHLTITGLSEISGASERTLRYAFLDQLRTTPQHYLISYRLHRARSLLLSGEATTVAGAAYSCGFRHFGRFSRYFKDTFGEFPSDVVPPMPPQGETFRAGVGKQGWGHKRGHLSA